MASTVRRYDVPPNGVYTDFRGWEGPDGARIPEPPRHRLGPTFHQERYSAVDAALVLAALIGAFVLRLL